MSFFKRLFGGKKEGDHELPSMPWDHGPSILEHIRSHIIAGKSGLADEGYTLPDEERIAQGSKIRWAAGAMDGVMTHDMGTGENDKAVRKTVELVLAYSRRPTVSNKYAVYQHIITEHIVSVIDPVLEALVNEKSISHDRLHELAYTFTTESPDREPVKLGIALLGLFRQATDEELFQTLGRHDEFTLFCAVAIANMTEDNQESLWTLARNVTGWGRVHVVERLAQTATNGAIKNWLLREGFRNSIMNEYLAGTCARAGGLLAALSGDQVDRELLTSAGEIIQALIAKGPGESIDDYEDARPVLEYYLDHMEDSAETIEDYLNTHAIKSYLNDDESRWQIRYDDRWTAECRDRLRLQCNSILDRPVWVERIRGNLLSKDESVFAYADQAAKTIGLNTWDIHWERLKGKPSEPGRWYHVMSHCNKDHIELVIDFAEANIDLSAIATGPGDELGLGRGFEQHSCLGFVLQDLRRFPGHGAKLIEAGLKSPVVSNRNMASTALASWPRGEWPKVLEMTLDKAVKVEPDDRAREHMQKVWRGEPLT